MLKLSNNNYCNELEQQLYIMFSRNIVEGRENSNTEQFQSDKKLLLFYAPWCGASKSFFPTWERLENELNTEKYDVDLDENKQIANEYNIEFLPTVYLVNNGQAKKYEGNRTYDDLVKFLQQLNQSTHFFSGIVYN